ncbi:hypothetical protein [Arthrobacter cryoconiti]|uniref:Novel STAND NTPase 3 domain-containing protein n=1 Tax=Arthrobacter cryoconiti TaxID=748907 RepID=A0ABV8QUN4_9MICC|nr:hypothetical protein [Arthrobacter cryoconiti]MCC9069770.1 hypothetical protein [Arthrobacter cryoconiti]
MTNATVSAASAAKIEDALKGVGVKHVLIYERNSINLAIATNGRLRRFVPRVYGLGDLSTILDERRYEQSKALIASMGQDLSTFVPTESHRRAVEAVEKHGFVMLLGDPASGKSVIASTLAAAAMHEWDCLVQRPTTPGGLVEGWNPNEPGQFFWLDDVFGSLRYDPSLAQSWVANAAHIKAAIEGGAKVVLTSRGYIWNEARKVLKTYIFPMISENQVVIDLAELTALEKQRMLYNHIRLGNQSRDFKKELRPFLAEVANMPSFKPEIARRLGAKEFTSGLSLSRSSVSHFFTHNEEFTVAVLEQLDDHYKAALSLVYMSVDGLQSPVAQSGIAESTLHGLGSDLGHVTQALNAMDGSFVRLVDNENARHWHFWHPTLREGFAGLISSNPELLGVFVAGLRPSNIVERLNCGGEKHKTGYGKVVSVPSSLYPQVVDRLVGFTPEMDHEVSMDIQGRRYADFLLSSTSDEFLSMMVAADPLLANRLLPIDERFDSSPVVRLCARMHGMGLLNEAARLWIVGQSLARAADVPDDSWVHHTVLDLHTEDERAEIERRVSAELGPNANEVISSWDSRWDSSDDPESYFLPLIECFDNYADYFEEVGLSTIGETFREASADAEEVKDWARENYDPAGQDDWDDDDRGISPAQDYSGRDVFDDVHR